MYLCARKSIIKLSSYMKKLLAILFALLLALPMAEAKKKPEPPKAPSKPKVEFTEMKEGLFGVSRKGQDWYFTVADSVLGQPILAITRYVNAPVGAGEYGGEMVNNQTVYFEQGPDSTLLLRALILGADAPEDDAIYKAVQVSSANPVLGSFKAERVGEAYRINVTKIFSDDTQAFSLSSRSKKQYNLGGAQRDASFIESIRTYPINTEVTVTKTFSYQQGDQRGPSGPVTSRGGGSSLMAGMKTGVVSIQLNTSFRLLPKNPMQRRLSDPRVGFFADQFSWFSDDQQQVKTRQFICRYRLEARPEDVEKQKRGELVEPIKPIIYYIDPATPKQWVPYLIAGVNDWNAAFEQAGWKNAIRGEEWPNDSTMSLEDARFSVIRYLASPIPNAYGPNVHDPRTGEILESHVGWYHNVMQLVHDWYQVQAGAIDPRTHQMKFSDELMGDLIRFVSSHEIGHTLGLRHNMGASSATPVEKLRDKAWVEAHGHTASIMDYARFNYVAQPEDNVSSKGIYPRINDYDKWAIEFGYKPMYAALGDEEKDHLLWNPIIIDSLQNNPRLWFGGEGRDHDPRAQTEDLGDNSMLASTYGVKNLKYIIKQLPEWTKEEADMNNNLKQVYESLLGQYQRYLRHVATNIGGLPRHLKSVEEAGDVYGITPKATQKEALKWLDENLFQKPEWLVAEPWMYRIAQRPDTYLFKQVDFVLGTTPLLELQTLSDLQLYADRSAQNYKPTEYLDDLYKVVFRELDSNAAVNTFRRYLQRAYITTAIARLNAKGSQEADARALLMAQMMKIQKKAKASAASDAVTKAHWADLANIIEQELLKK